jgi:hypothetical protein
VHRPLPRPSDKRPHENDVLGQEDVVTMKSEDLFEESFDVGWVGLGQGLICAMKALS